MKSKKVKVPKLNDREALVAFCSTLSQEKCKEAYIILQEHFQLSRRKILRFNKSGIEESRGKVRLTPTELNKLLSKYSQEVFLYMIEVLYSYLDYLEEHKDEPKYKSKLNRYATSTHYRVMTGWVLDRVVQYHPNVVLDSAPVENELSFYDIESQEQALKYLKLIPLDLRWGNPEIEYLTSKFPDLIGKF